MNNEKKVTIVLAVTLSICITGVVFTIAKVTANGESKASKNDISLELEKEAQKVREANTYNDLEEKAPVEDINESEVAEENAMKDMNIENNGTVVTEIKDSEISFIQPLKAGTYKIVDQFDDKYEGFNQLYIETLIFAPSFNKGNPGIIYKAENSKEVYSMADGVVAEVGDNTEKKCGYSIIIEHSNAIKTEYYCLTKVNVTVGEKIKKGQKIAEVGDLGNSLIKDELRVYMLESDKLISPLKYVK